MFKPRKGKYAMYAKLLEETKNTLYSVKENVNEEGKLLSSHVHSLFKDVLPEGLTADVSMLGYGHMGITLGITLKDGSGQVAPDDSMNVSCSSVDAEITYWNLIVRPLTSKDAKAKAKLDIVHCLMGNEDALRDAFADFHNACQADFTDIDVLEAKVKELTDLQRRYEKEVARDFFHEGDWFQNDPKEGEGPSFGFYVTKVTSTKVCLDEFISRDNGVVHGMTWKRVNSNPIVLDKPYAYRQATNNGWVRKDVPKDLYPAEEYDASIAKPKGWGV